jgi:cobyrinic acid a,c-diamide synthase
VPVLGVLRRQRLTEAVMPPRASGVVPVLHRSIEASRAVRQLGEIVAAGVDIDRLLAIARSAPKLAAEPWSPDDSVGQHLVYDDEPTSAFVPAHLRPIVAVAGGQRLSFGYPEVAELLTAAGAQVVPVDLLRDESLPAGTAGLVIGGGLPEAYLDEAAANESLLNEVRALGRAGRPIVAEGAGVALLAREYDNRPMTGLLDISGRLGEHMVLGYREATARSDSSILTAGTKVVGHRHHRGMTTPRSGTQAAWTWPDGAPEGFVYGRVHASYLCLHWVGAAEIAQRFVAALDDSSIMPLAA